MLTSQNTHSVHNLIRYYILSILSNISHPPTPSHTHLTTNPSSYSTCLPDYSLMELLSSSPAPCPIGLMFLRRHSLLWQTLKVLNFAHARLAQPCIGQARALPRAASSTFPNARWPPSGTASAGQAPPPGPWRWELSPPHNISASLFPFGLFASSFPFVSVTLTCIIFSLEDF